MAFGNDMDMWRARPNQVEFLEKGKEAKYLTIGEGKLYGITGVSFLLDSYELIIIQHDAPRPAHILV
jgi:hypothetical protein